MSDQLEDFVPENLSPQKGQRYRPYGPKQTRPASDAVGLLPRVMAVVFVVAVLGLLATGMAPPGVERTTAQVMLSIALGGVAALAAALIYFLPYQIAKSRDHRNVTSILILNVFFGWTLLGWVGALCWAIYVDRDDPRQ